MSSRARTFTDEPDDSHFNAVWDTLVASTQSLPQSSSFLNLDQVEEDAFPSLDQEEAPSSLHSLPLEKEELFPAPSSSISVAPLSVKKPDPVSDIVELSDWKEYAIKQDRLETLQHNMESVLESAFQTAHSESSSSDTTSFPPTPTPKRQHVIHKPIPIRPIPMPIARTPPGSVQKLVNASASMSHVEKEEDGGNSTLTNQPDAIASMSVDERFSWRVEHLGFLEAMRLLELDEIADKHAAKEELHANAKAELEFAFQNSKESRFLTNVGGYKAGVAEVSSNDYQTQLMMDYVLGANSSFAEQFVRENRNEMDNLLLVKQSPLESPSPSLHGDDFGADAEDDENDGDEKRQGAKILSLGTLVMAVGILSVAGYLIFGRGKRRAGRR
ncbi:hypothetical protein HDU98_011169 [Podochytrium sp. JEL0797]|nr:hypothetical protein HDU98_011169 [Podochytrium sp. JEL0797]